MPSVLGEIIREPSIHYVDAPERENIVNAATLGWIIWGLGCVTLLWTLADVLWGRSRAHVGLLFSACVATGLALTFFTALSKFHLLWVLPVAACIASGEVGTWLAQRKVNAEFETKRRIAANIPPLNSPTFGTLKWTEYDWWEGKTCLPGWAGFQSRGGPYSWKDSASPSDGSATLIVKVHDSEIHRNPSEAQRQALEFQIKSGDEVVQSVLAALLPWYREVKRNCELDDDLMPSVSSSDEFRKMMGLSQVHIHSHLRDGLGYVGLEFGCDWDEDHGFGVMLHGASVVDIGSAETSFSEKPDEAQSP